MTAADRSQITLMNHGRILSTAGKHLDGRTQYRIELDQGGITQAPGPDGQQPGARATLRRYQVNPPVGSPVRGPLEWLTVDPQDSDPTLPPDTLGRPAEPARK